MSAGPGSFGVSEFRSRPGRLPGALFSRTVASASSPSAPAQPRKPEVFLAQAQTRPGGLDSTAEAGRSAVPRDHFSPVFVTEEFPFQHFRAMQAAAWPRGFSLELRRAGVDSRATRRKGEGRGALDIPFQRLFHPQTQGK